MKRFGERALNRTGFFGYVAGYTMLAFCHSLPCCLPPSRSSRWGPGAAHAHQPGHARHAAGRTGHDPGTHPVAHVGFSDYRSAAGGLLIQHHLLTTWGLAAAAIALLGLSLAARPASIPVYHSAQIDT